MTSRGAEGYAHSSQAAGIVKRMQAHNAQAD